MTMPIRRAATATLLALAAVAATGRAAPAGAQVPLRTAAEADTAREWHPQWGDWALGFALPYGGGAGLSFWKFRGPRLALGLSIDGAYDRQRLDTPDGTLTGTAYRLAAGPALRRYWWSEGPVSPFLRSDLTALYEYSDMGAPSWRIGGAFSLGIGAEWFPARGIGVGGYTGASAQYTWISDDDDVADDAHRLNVRLFTSALVLHLYF